VSIGAYASYKVVRDLILDNLKEKAVSEVQRGVDTLDEWLANRKTLDAFGMLRKNPSGIEVETISNTPTVRTRDWSVVAPYWKAEIARLQNFYHFAMVDQDGWYYTTRVGKAKVNIKNRKHIQQAMAGKVYVSDPVDSKTLGTHCGGDGSGLVGGDRCWRPDRGNFWGDKYRSGG